jgi:hypothetical protein
MSECHLVGFPNPHCALVAYYMTSFVISLCQCIPRERIWKSTMEGRCFNHALVILSAGIMNLIIDFEILAIPVAAIARLHMALNQKLGATSVFAVGIL